MANRIVGDLGNKLIIYGYRKPLRSHTYLPFLPEAIVDEFIDATVVREHASKEQEIYQIYYWIEGDGEFIFRIIVSYLEDSITILADDVNIAVRAYKALCENLARWKLH
ncbi:hypothetical protein [Paenibacillus popilliae]|uniref:Uncharacterized protein n=1 Tax=Paenibacillus popilliae TaxID=78057 RepID=A0ABY3AWS3_PAEPP|nr:hypothetical protein [Paenibacillus sp. SDF0028]TQR47186.1 hypothetical protein C7Y44_06090 [Paenibacillus sp. SDF0028]